MGERAKEVDLDAWFEKLRHDLADKYFRKFKLGDIRAICLDLKYARQERDAARKELEEARAELAAFREQRDARLRWAKRDLELHDQNMREFYGDD